MLRHLRSNLVAYLALLVALGGTSYAAVQLPKNSVKQKQIAPGAVRSSEVRDGSLKAGDFASGQLPVGPPGPPGAAGSVAFAAAANFGAADPGGTPDGAGITPQPFTLPSAGKAYLEVHIPGASLVCSAGSARLGMYVDSQPVPGTSIPITGTQSPYTVVGVSGLLAAGAHSVSLTSDCPGGNVTSAGTSGGGGIYHTVMLLGAG